MTGRRWSWAGLPTVTATAKPAITVLGDDRLNIPSGPEARGWLETGDLDHRGRQLQNDLPQVIHAEIDRLALRIQRLLDAGWRSVKVVTDHGWLFCPGGGARLLVEDDELEGAVVVAVLISFEGRVVAQRRTVVGGEA